MRWERLFDDLSAQADAVSGLELDEEVAERTRFELGQLSLADRLRGALGVPITVETSAVDGRLRGQVLRVAADAAVVEDDRGQALVPLAAIRFVRDPGPAARSAGPSRVSGQVGLRSLLRSVAADRRPVVVSLTDPGGALTGTIDAVGKDLIELAEHPLDLARRASAVQHITVVPLTAIALVRLG